MRAPAVPAATAAVRTALAPWASGTVQPNFVGVLNGPDALDRAWSPEVRDRLARVRVQYDPAGVLAR